MDLLAHSGIALPLQWVSTPFYRSRIIARSHIPLGVASLGRDTVFIRTYKWARFISSLILAVYPPTKLVT